MPGQARSRVLLGAGVVVLIILGIARGWFVWPASAVVRGSAPFIGSLTDAARSVGGVVGSFLRVAKLSRTVRVLEEENTRLQSLVARLGSVEDENSRLREELRLRPRGTFRLVTADVVSYSTEGTASVILINRGARDGITPAAPVIVREGILVGRVRSVEPLSASVALLADSSVRASARSVGTGAEGLAHGVRGLEVVFDTVPRTATLSPGDRVVTAGLDGVFPPHLFIGTIAAVDTPQNDIYQSARLTPALPPGRLRVVSIIVEPHTGVMPSTGRPVAPGARVGEPVSPTPEDAGE